MYYQSWKHNAEFQSVNSYANEKFGSRPKSWSINVFLYVFSQSQLCRVCIRYHFLWSSGLTLSVSQRTHWCNPVILDLCKLLYRLLLFEPCDKWSMSCPLWFQLSSLPSCNADALQATEPCAPFTCSCSIHLSALFYLAVQKTCKRQCGGSFSSLC